MAEKKGVGHAYNVDFLNVVFAASSLFLLLSVVWMVWDDYNREWKKTQRHFSDLEVQVTQAQLQQATRAVDQNKLKQLQAQEAAAQKNVEANRGKVDELQKKLTDADNTLFRATLDYNYMKATYDQDRYDYETSRVADPNSSATKKKQALADDEAKKLSELNLAMEKAIAEKAEVQKQLGQYTGAAAGIAGRPAGDGAASTSRMSIDAAARRAGTASSRCASVIVRSASCRTCGARVAAAPCRCRRG